MPQSPGTGRCPGHPTDRSVLRTMPALPGSGLWQALLLLGLSLAFAGLAFAQAGADPLESRPVTLLTWLLFIGVFVLLWVLFYYLLYPYLVRYYHPGVSKVIFWLLFIFYSLTWLHLSLYLIFEVASYYPWTQWVAVFISGIWILWFVIVVVRSR